jgi:hypothetical protein
MLGPDILRPPCKEYQATVRNCEFDEDGWKLRSFLQRAQPTKIGQIYQSMGKVVKQHRAIALENSWSGRMLEMGLRDHGVLGEIAYSRDSSEFPVTCLTDD